MTVGIPLLDIQSLLRRLGILATVFFVVRFIMAFRLISLYKSFRIFPYRPAPSDSSSDDVSQNPLVAPWTLVSSLVFEDGG
ncbi:hypothetical protein C8J56DRAFT_48807 [Mycena floridula]|nr:hypothetical protein C8J56DRAFT_48807 [Mycena floridula]